MTQQISFIVVLLITLGVFGFTMSRIFSYFRLTKPFPINDFGKRFILMFRVAIAQTKIFRFPVIGFIHAMVFWGFILITIGSLEMVFDGVMGTERLFAFMGPLYDAVIFLGDFFAWYILLAMLIFLFRRIFMHINRFYGEEMKPISKIDANIALTIILLLMVSLIGYNSFYMALHPDHAKGAYAFSSLLVPGISGLQAETLELWERIFWWSHILLIFIFANILPYSKHFHVFMSVPNVFLSRLYPLGHLENMDNVTKEVRLMLDPNAAFQEPAEDEEIQRFGVKDVEDLTWKNYLDSLACTECGRCTSVCPANITGKKLSPRKIMVDLRARMKEKGPGLVKDASFDDGKSYLRSFISEEELWACTTCNACAQECPININHPSVIVDLRRYLVMEESAAPAGLNMIFNNIENNGAPWQFSPEDRMLWADDLFMNDVASKN